VKEFVRRMAPLTLLFVTLFNSILGLSVLFPVLAPLGRTLGLSEFEIGSLTGAYALMQLVFSPFWGRLSERRGRGSDRRFKHCNRRRLGGHRPVEHGRHCRQYCDRQ